MKNLEERKCKMSAATTTINAIAETDVLRTMETPVILELHEKINIPALLTNCESWNLNKGERIMLEKIEIQTLKYLFDLPSHTPTPAIIHTFGVLYTGQRLDKRRLIYLHRILKRHDQHWTKKAFYELERLNLGWCKNIKETLRVYDLPTDLDTIKAMTKRKWTKLVSEKVEVKNTQRLLDDCYKLVNGTRVPKTKTTRIITDLTNDTYQHNPGM